MDRPWFENIDVKITVRGPLAIIIMPALFILTASLWIGLAAAVVVLAPIVGVAKLGRKLGTHLTTKGS